MSCIKWKSIHAFHYPPFITMAFYGSQRERVDFFLYAKWWDNDRRNNSNVVTKWQCTVDNDSCACPTPSHTSPLVHRFQAPRAEESCRLNMIQNELRNLAPEEKEEEEDEMRSQRRCNSTRILIHLNCVVMRDVVDVDVLFLSSIFKRVKLHSGTAVTINNFYLHKFFFNEI